ncbi:hypothetical protein [Psychroserpens jangbogonensis]|uniref:hypothetical protein n=1 Tax=Psychroserpens jangbogonensis TaxID=1484460 RepID=UPI00053D5408|nr:hypothetical protein [Psychroserpens jangbogonensis]
MKLFAFLKNIFVKASNNPFEKKIRKMGYKKEKDGTFLKLSHGGRTMIWLSSQGVKIKVYASGYGESDFLPYSILDEDRLERFILENEL